MLCCSGIASFDNSKMSRRTDYKVSTELELEPLNSKPADLKTNGINKYGNRRQEGPVKLSVVGSGGGPGNSGIWRRERIVMADADTDDVAFLTGRKLSRNDSNSGRPQREGVAVCSQKRALCVTAAVLGALLGSAIIIAYAGPQSVCPCAGKIPPGFVPEGENHSEPFQPIATNGQSFPWLHPYLPSNIRPIRYTLTIHPNLTTLDVKGQVTIEFHVDKETNFIVLHAQDLNITEKAIVGPKGYQLKIVKLLEYPPRQQVYIELKDRLRKKSNYTLSIRWYSRLVYEPEGFYVDEYDGTNGFKRLLAATVLGPGTARKAFPCFDEPHLRAPFKISLFRDRFHIGLSNSIVHATDDVGFYMGTGLLRDDFLDTPPLPADAISWVVSDFQREILEPSSTYQLTTPGNNHLTTSTTTATPSLSDKLLKMDDSKKSMRNITAILRQGLVVKMQAPNTQHPPHLHDSHHVTTAASLTIEKNSSAISTEHGITSAPSYTFYASKETLPLSRYILHMSRDVLEHLQMWLGVAYPLPKLDFVALPSLNDDLISSLGLISCRTSFLREPGTITTREYHRSALGISEAIVKQYFGGIISPKIWKHSWLWEGLIKYLSRAVLIPLQPQWPMDQLHLLETFTNALDNDAVQGWESILLGTNENGENDDFYVEKSAALLGMLHSAIGDDDFRACLGTFIGAYKFQTAEPIDLWAICKKRVNGTKNIKEMMNLWTTLAGFPLLNVTKNGYNVTIKQKGFLAAEFLAVLEEQTFDNQTDDGSSSTTTAIPTTTTTLSPKEAKKRRDKWIFPISYITNAETIADNLWFNSTEVDFSLHYDVKWIKINSEQNGYFRVLYDQNNWNNLIEQLKINHNVFSAKDRMGLVSDAFTLCHANLMSCQITMSLISYLPKELDWGPMTIALRHLERWRKILKYSECYISLAEYVKTILAKAVNETGWEDIGSDELRLVRPEVLMALVLWEEPDGLSRASTLLHNHIANNTVIPANLRSVAYIGAVLSGNFLYWQFCWDRYTALRKEKDRQDERFELLRALGVTKDAWLQNRLLAHVSSLPPNEIVQVLEAIAGTPTGGAMACRFLQAKWFSLQAKLGKGTVNFARAIGAITQYGSSRFDYEELKSLVERFGEGPGIRTLNMTLKTVAGNVEWVTRSQNSIYTWVESNYHLR